MATKITIENKGTQWQCYNYGQFYNQFVKLEQTYKTEIEIIDTQSSDESLKQPPNQIVVVLEKVSPFDLFKDEYVDYVNYGYRLNIHGTTYPLSDRYTYKMKRTYIKDISDYKWFDTETAVERSGIIFRGNEYTWSELKEELNCGTTVSYLETSNPTDVWGEFNLMPYRTESFNPRGAYEFQGDKHVLLSSFQLFGSTMLSDFRNSISYDFDGLQYAVLETKEIGGGVSRDLTRQELIAFAQNKTVPDRFILSYNDLDDKQPPQGDITDDSGNPSDWKKDTDKDNLDDNDTHDTPSASPISCKGALNNYVIHSTTGINNIFKWFWNDMIDEVREDDFLDYVTGVFDSLGQALVSVRMYPFTIATTEQEKMVLGRYESNLTLSKLPSGSNLLCSHNYEIKRTYGNFMDYAPYTQLLIFLPMIGLKELDTNLFMGRTVKIKYFVDYSTGAVDCYILSGNTVISHFSGKIGAEVPYTLDSGRDLGDIVMDKAFSATVSTIGSIAGAGASAVAGPVGGAVVGGLSSFASDMANGNTSQTNIYSTNPTNGNIMNEPSKIQIFYIYPSYSQPSSYGKNVGYVLEKTKNLNVLQGLTVCKNPIMTYGATKHNNKTIYPYETEIEEINMYLSKGVYL